MRKKNRAQGIILSDFRLYYKAAVIKTVLNRHRNRHTHQQNRIQSPEINPCIPGELIQKRRYLNRLFKKKGFGGE